MLVFERFFIQNSLLNAILANYTCGDFMKIKNLYTLLALGIFSISMSADNPGEIVEETAPQEEGD